MATVPQLRGNLRVNIASDLRDHVHVGARAWGQIALALTVAPDGADITIDIGAATAVIAPPPAMDDDLIRTRSIVVEGDHPDGIRAVINALRRA